MSRQGYFQPCYDCDRPGLCAVLKPQTQPCYYTPEEMEVATILREFGLTPDDANKAARRVRCHLLPRRT